MKKECSCKSCDCENFAETKDYNEWLRNIECTGKTIVKEDGSKIRHIDIVDKVADLFDCIPPNTVVNIPKERIPPKIVHVGYCDHDNSLMTEYMKDRHIDYVDPTVIICQSAEEAMEYAKSMEPNQIPIDYNVFENSVVNSMARAFQIPVDIINKGFKDFNDALVNSGVSDSCGYFGHAINKILKKQPSLFKNKYCTYLDNSGNKRTGIILKTHKRSVKVQPVSFHQGITRLIESPDGKIITRNLYTYKVRVYDYGIRPIN